MSAYYSDSQVTLWHGRDVDVLRQLPNASVDCCVTSPPYFGLRDYGVDGQRGLEQSPAEYVAGMVEVFREVRRVLADYGTMRLNVGDSYYSGKGSPTQPDLKNEARRPESRILDRPGADWAKPKDLLGVPWRVAFALQEDGWYLRNAVIWHKPNGMPESITDRLSTRYEHVFLMSKSRRYWFDLDAIREPLSTLDPSDPSYRANGKSDRRRKSHAVPPGQSPQTNMVPTGTRHTSTHEAGRNPGDLWSINTQPFGGAHFAVMPLVLAGRCVLAGCRPGGTVLDPYSGSGTTGLAATKHGRRYVGIDLNAEYLDLSLRTRLQQAALIPDEEAS